MLANDQRGPDLGSVLSFSVDTRWTHGRLRLERDLNAQHLPEEPPYELPFLGWSVVVVAGTTQDGPFETAIQPTFLVDGNLVRTLDDINETTTPEGYTALLAGLR